MSTILCLDLGTKTGWAFKNDDGSITHGVENFSKKKNQADGIKYFNFKNWLNNFRESVKRIDYVVYEKVNGHKGLYAAHTYGGFMAMLMSWCEHHNIFYESIPVGTIKKRITGIGNATKQQMIDAVKARGFNPINDNDADALAILLIVS